MRLVQSGTKLEWRQRELITSRRKEPIFCLSEVDKEGTSRIGALNEKSSEAQIIELNIDCVLHHKKITMQVPEAQVTAEAKEERNKEFS